MSTFHEIARTSTAKNRLLERLLLADDHYYGTAVDENAPISVLGLTMPVI